ncbi:MAG: diheme cytochrome c-553 [Acidobacteriota bacterium]
MKKTLHSVAAASVVVGLALLSARGEAAPNPSGSKASLARGKYLVSILGCNDCHTPWKIGPKGPEPDMSRMLSGHPESLKMPPPPKPSGPWTSSIAGTFTVFAGPWGVSYVPNITPDQNTGIGIWTEDLFIKAIRTGKHYGTSREILPPMPWPAYRNMTDADLKGIYAYLRSIPAITNHVPDSEPAPPPPGAPAPAPTKR